MSKKDNDYQASWIFDIRIIFVYVQYGNFQKYYPAIHFPQIHPQIFTPIS